MLAPFPWYNRKRSKNNSLVEYGVLWIYVQEWNNWVLWEFYFILFVKFPNCPSIPTSSVFVARFCDDSHTYHSELIWYLKIVWICEFFFKLLVAFASFYNPVLIKNKFCFWDASGFSSKITNLIYTQLQNYSKSQRTALSAVSTVAPLLYTNFPSSLLFSCSNKIPPSKAKEGRFCVCSLVAVFPCGHSEVTKLEVTRHMASIIKK